MRPAAHHQRPASQPSGLAESQWTSFSPVVPRAAAPGRGALPLSARSVRTPAIDDSARRAHPVPPASARPASRPHTSSGGGGRGPSGSFSSASASGTAARSTPTPAQACSQFQNENLAKYSLAPPQAPHSARRSGETVSSRAAAQSRPGTSHFHAALSSSSSPQQQQQRPPWPSPPPSQPPHSAQRWSADEQEESKESFTPAPPSRGASSYRPHPSSAHASTTKRYPTLANVDLCWSPLAVRLPPALEPRTCVENSMALARAELGFIHSGVFDVAPASSGLGAKRARTKVHASQPPPPFAIPPSLHMHLPLSLVEPVADLPDAAARPRLQDVATSHAPRRASDEQQSSSSDEDDADGGIDIEALLQAHEAFTGDMVLHAVSSSHPTSRPRTPDAASAGRRIITAADAAAAAAEIAAAQEHSTAEARASHRAWLARLNAQYDAELASNDAAAVDAEQQRIFAEYEAKKAEQWRSGKQQQRKTSKPADNNRKSSAITRAAADEQKLEAEHQSEKEHAAPEEKEASASSAAAASATAAVVSAPAPIAAASAAPSAPAVAPHSQYAAYDPSIDAGIDVAALPLAFQLPASLSGAHSSSAASGGSEASPQTKLEELEQSIAAQIDRLCGVTPPADPEDAAQDLAASKAANGMDVEQAVALEGLASSTASAREVLQRYREYQERLNAKKEPSHAAQISAALDAKLLIQQKKRQAASTASPKRPPYPALIEHAYGVEVPDHDALENEAGAVEDADPADEQPAAVDNSPPRAPAARALTAPGSAAAFFQPANVASAVSAAPAQAASVDASASSAHVRSSSGGSHIRQDSFRTATITTGWASALVRQESHRVHAKLNATRKDAVRGSSHAGSGDVVAQTRQDKPMNMDEMCSTDDEDAAAAEEDASKPSDPVAAAALSRTNSSGSPFARPSSALSQRSWSNRIKRDGVGESAGRGSDARKHTAELNAGISQRPLSAYAQKLLSERESEADRLRQNEIDRRERLAEEAILAAHESGTKLIAVPPPEGARGRPSASGASQAERMKQREEAKSAHLPSYMRQLDRDVARATAKEPLGPQYVTPSAASDTASEVALVPASPRRRRGRHSCSPDKSASSGQVQLLPHSAVFPPWLWSRRDFQASYNSVPFEVCLRILHLFPDERTEMHIAKLREWIMRGEAFRQSPSSSAATSSVTVSASTPGGSAQAATTEGHSGSVSARGAPPSLTRALSPAHNGSFSARGAGGPPSSTRSASSPTRSRMGSRAVSRSSSRAVLSRALSLQHPASPAASDSAGVYQCVTLPPNSTDFLSSLSTPMLNGCLRVMKVVSFAAGDTIYSQGSVGDCFYIVQSGKVQSKRMDTFDVPRPAVAAVAPSVATPGTGSMTHSSNLRSPLSSSSRSSARRSSLTVPQHHLHVNTSSPRPVPSTPATSRASARSSVTFSEHHTPVSQPPFQRQTSSSMRGQPPPHLTVPSTPHAAAAGQSSMILGTETFQMLQPGSAFGHFLRAGHEHGGEAHSHAAVARKRTLRLWNLLRLSVRRGLRSEDNIHTQLSRLTYGSTAGDRDGSHALRRSMSPRGLGRRSNRSSQGARSTSSSLARPSGISVDDASSSGLSETRLRSETVVALTDCSCFLISFYAYASLSFEVNTARIRAGINFLSQVRFFRTWTFSRLRHLFSLVVCRDLKRGEVLWRQGSPAEDLAFVEQGSLSLSREAFVTEGHRTPTGSGVGMWECMESSHSISGGPFGSIGQTEYIGEEIILDSNTNGNAAVAGASATPAAATEREYTVRCKSETARVWLLRKRYAHLLRSSATGGMGGGSAPGWVEDVARLRRKVASLSVVRALAERYPQLHSAHPFTPVDWVAARRNDLGSGGPQANHVIRGGTGPGVGYGSGILLLDMKNEAEFLYLAAGAVYVRWDPPGALIRRPAAAAPTPTAAATPASATAAALPSAAHPAASPASVAAARPRRVYRLYTVPHGGASQDPAHLTQNYSALTHAGSHLSGVQRSSASARAADEANRMSFVQVVAAAQQSPLLRAERRLKQSQQQQQQQQQSEV